MATEEPNTPKEPPLKHTYLSHTGIEYPENNHVYHIINPDNPSLESQLTFVGDLTKHIYFNVLTGVIKKTDTLANIITCLCSSHYCFISPYSLPVHLNKDNLPSILMYIFNVPGKLYFQSIYTLKVNTISDTALTAIATVRVRSAKRKLEYQQWAGSIPISYGQHPIFVEKNRPLLQNLTEIFQSFITFNPPEKLFYQAFVTNFYCHIRAFFFCEILRNVYGITSEIAFKTWKADDWIPFSTRRWDFHCVAKVGKWIFDPWEGCSSNWISLKKWFNRYDEPKPTQIIFNHSMVFSDYKLGRKADGLDFMQSPYLPREYITKFQFLCADAIPKIIERPLITAKREAVLYLCHHNFFKRAPKVSTNSNSVESYLGFTQ